MNACSVVFYAYWSVQHLAVFIISIVANYLLSRFIKEKNKKALILAIVANLGLLSYFKYTNFMIDQINLMMGQEITFLNIVLPIGISFFTFQQIAWQVDLYRGEAQRVSFMRYFFFVSFFPQLIAGPIVHHTEIFPQLKKHKKHLQNLCIGLTIFLIGLFKKTMIADQFAPIATPIFDMAQSGKELTMIEAWSGALAYSLQIYFDFSAYSDMAIGLARMFGIKLPQNFASPYKSTSIIDFWRRWHITLSRFLRDYLYISLGGNRKGIFRRYFNVGVTMLLGGLWHGASWNFVLWGALHGAFIIVNQIYRQLGYTMNKFLGWFITIILVIFSWVPFRATDLQTTLIVWQGMLGNFGFAQISDDFIKIVDKDFLLLLVIGIGIALFTKNTAELMKKFEPVLNIEKPAHSIFLLEKIEWSPTKLWAIFFAIVGWLSLLKLNEPSEFLYFQF